MQLINGGQQIVNSKIYQTLKYAKSLMNKYNRLQRLICHMSSQYTSKLITELKHQTPDVDIAGLLYLLNRLIHKKYYPLQYIYKFITHNYSHQAINWKTIDQQAILNLYHQSIDFIQHHQKRWTLEAQRLQQLTNEYVQQKKRIKKILKEKSLTKHQLIDSYLEEIRRNQTILAKTSPLKHPPNQSSQSILPNDKYKYQLNIQLLQKRINIMKDTAKFDRDNYDKTLSSQVNPHFDAQQKILNKIVEELQFKINYFEDLQKNTRLEEAFQKKKQLIAKTKSLNKKIKQLFLHYSSENYDPSLSFQINQFKLVHIDLRLFLKYFKELKDAHPREYFVDDQKNDKKFKTNNLTVMFKKYAHNQRQIDFIKFLQINYQLFFNKANAFHHSTEAQILGQTKQKIKIETHESLSQFQQELLKLQEVKDVFYNQKVNKIININQKYEETNQDAETLGTNFQKKSNQNALNQTKKKQKKIGKFIDKTLEDYESTKNNIHQTFLRRHRKETVQSFEQRLSANQKDSIKIIVSKDKNSFTSKINDKNGFRKRLQDEANLAHSRNKTDLDILLSNKNIFNQIIKEVEEQNYEDESLHKFKYQKSRSSADLIAESDRKSKGYATKNIESSLSKRRSSTGSLKSVFTLPKITRLSEQRIENQSITKTLTYLYNKLGRQEQPKIKKILQIDNLQSQKAHKIQNQYLKQYFSQQTNSETFQLNMEQKNKHRKQEVVKPSCKKFKEENYSKFMKFS